MKIANQDEKIENRNAIEFFCESNKFVDGTTIVGGDLVKCCIQYWKHYAYKHHGSTLQLAVMKQLIKGWLIIKDNYNVHSSSYRFNLDI